ncbi:MAG: hypothetical protein ACI4OS_03430 [Akkermansia sp.]
MSIRPRSLRPVNARLYLGFVLIIWAAAGYVLCVRDSLPQQLTAAGAALVSLIWGGYYLRLRYRVDAQGITRRGLWRSEYLPWQGSELRLRRHRQGPEIAGTELTLSRGGQSLCLSSELLDPDELETLIADLRAAGLLAVV